MISFETSLSGPSRINYFLPASVAIEISSAEADISDTGTQADMKQVDTLLGKPSTVDG